MGKCERGHRDNCSDLVPTNDLIQLTMRNKTLCVAAKMANGDCYTTSYFSVKEIHRNTGCVVLQLIRPIFRSRLLLIRTNQMILINVDSICATQRLDYPIFDCVELQSTTCHRRSGNVCTEWSAQQSIIYKNYSRVASIAFFTFSYWKGDEKQIKLRIISRTRKDILLTIGKGETIGVAIPNLLQVEIIRPSCRIIGCYTNSLHQLYTKRVEDYSCRKKYYFIERALISEAMQLSSVTGLIFQNYTNQSHTATLTIQNTTNGILKSAVDDVTSIIIPPKTSRSVTLSNIDRIKITQNDAQQPVCFHLTFHAVI